ncbi:FKBP-type peptidyl-prolyl cis-trans isomerase [Cytophaga hutchinsonii]|jgi:FKBP-type peptidyl-prolyl cis-trans isomerase FkpA|uniref:Peptidyl-prolyl cis-trans isomerase n=1 Tax=Cytophaga hutchinsonii (strain ATCC 33406 / DSM 1761 / CIP 103989 / NBRC 15051 / NCIMB 9469 / D465) TaxID=269798 RepID=A0A6N4SWG0_CYTH3|nr:FKBP-type peptidyl-prolyl cis-trans isomerase [Cytophaga hutchinsonii]ABG60883.1 FKBP-type peptidyl-prolyl cis-trans isomerase (rotamase) [Cytophaga hutchinsonii ATCC 33406]SFX99727.1 FKBP-type peptidyl-prolyl cis-trans isomerase [Cytophaga hutchinsonii ATCC 33406]
MLKKSLSLLAGAVMLASITSCNKFEKTESGLEYKILKDSSGEDYPEKGGFITFWFEIQNDKDSTLDTQFKDPNPVGIPTPDVAHKPSIEEGFMLLTEGDSAVFLLNADSLYANTFHQKLPAHIKSGSNVKMVVRMGKVYSKSFVDSVMAVQEQQMANQMLAETEVYKKDSLAIQNYLTKNKLKGQPTIGGVYVVKLKQNNATDLFIAPGDSIETSYVGKLLIEGTEFDKSRDGQPFKFTVGMGQVIKGWDEGFQKLKRGEKALLLIPSRLAYGSRGAQGAIPPNSPLLFEVEVKK